MRFVHQLSHAGRRHCSQDGMTHASFLSAGITSAGRLTQASNASQSLAGIVTTVRSSGSASAASTAFRRTKSLRLVRAWWAAAARIARSSALTRTLRIEVADVGLAMDTTIAYATEFSVPSRFSDIFPPFWAALTVSCGPETLGRCDSRFWVKFRESRRSQRRPESARLLDCEGCMGAVAGANIKGIARVRLADGSIHLA